MFVPKPRTEYYKVTKLAPLTTNPKSKPGPAIPHPIPADLDKTFPFHTAQLEHNFTDRNEVQQAMEKLDNQKQGREGALVYFLRIEQHAAAAGINLLEDPHAILRCERGLNEDLVDQIYSRGLIPNTYAGYHDHAITLGNIARSQMSWKESNLG